jgi:hypothetical protein
MISEESNDANSSSTMFNSMSQKWQYILDKSSPQIALRWSLMTVVMFAYMLRVYLLDGWYIVTYGLGIYLLNQLIGFLSPQVYILSVLGILSFVPMSSLTPRKVMMIWAFQLGMEKNSGDMISVSCLFIL